MKINWKKAFWLQLVLCICLTGYLGYMILDQSITITYMKEGYEDTERDLNQLSKTIEGRLSRKDFQKIIKKYPDYNGEDLELNRLKISFREDGIVDSITSNW